MSASSSAMAASQSIQIRSESPEDGAPGTSTKVNPPSDGVASLWLEAFHDPLASIQALQACMCTADVFGDGESRFVVAENSRKIRVWKGTSMVMEQTLLSRPTGMTAFFPDTQAPRIPSLAVASGPFIYIYRNLRPFFKFSIPPMELSNLEVEAWKDAQSEGRKAADLLDQLQTLRMQGLELSAQSLHLLSLSTLKAQEDFLYQQKEHPLVQLTVATCIAAIKKQVDEPDAMSCVVFGTESRQIFILQSSGQAVLWKGTLPSVPAFLSVMGQVDVDYRIMAACRDANVYSIKNNEVMASSIQMEVTPCGILTVGKNIVVGCMNSTLHSFHIKGKKNWTVTLPSPIFAMELVALERQRNTRAVAVGLANGEIRVYNESHLVSLTRTSERVTSLHFGSFAREDNALLSVARGGALTVRILPRSANLEAASGAARGPPAEQDIPLSIPKKTKVFVEQTQREREQAVEMHRIFQRDLCKLRLATACAYVKVLTDGQGPISYTAGASLRLNAQVHGLGPLFKVKLNIQNTGTRPVTDLLLSVSYNPKLYFIQRPLLQIPILIPSVLYHQEVEVRCLDECGGADTVKIYVSNGSISSVPVLSAIVKMPLVETLWAS